MTVSFGKVGERSGAGQTGQGASPFRPADAPVTALKGDETLRQMLAPILAYCDKHKDVTELAVNRPGQMYVLHGADWTAHDAPELTEQRLKSLITAVGSYTGQQAGPMLPLLSADLPGGQRIQIVQTPAVERGTISLTIRIPGSTVRTLEQYEHDGVFKEYRWVKSVDSNPKQGAAFGAGVAGRSTQHQSMGSADTELMGYLQTRRLKQFFEAAVRHKKTIAFVGDTGSGKTSLMKSLCQYIPQEERLITIEDVRELFLKQDNRVHLLYSKGGQGIAKVTPADLIAACMRMNPSRVLLAELRGSEAYDMLKLLTTGHRGSITSFHADSTALAFERFVFMCKEHTDASVYDAKELKRLFSLTFDVIAHIEAVDTYSPGGGPLRRSRRITEVFFDPVGKEKTAFENR